MGRAAVAITLSASERRELDGLARRRKTAQGLARLGADRVGGGRWAGEQGDCGAGVSPTRTRSASGVGALPSIGSTASTTNRVPGLRARSTISGSPRSSAVPWKRRRPMARTGACVRWPGPLAMPHRPSTGFGRPSDCSRIAARRSSCLRTRCFVEKVRDIVGLYLAPPERGPGAVRGRKEPDPDVGPLRPLLPMRPGQVERRTHDYVRHGTTTLFAAWTPPPARSSGSAFRATAHGSSWPSCVLSKPGSPTTSTSIW